MYARAFDTVEVDSTFYAIPAPRTIRDWAERVPDDFQFALNHEITHENRLRNVAPALEQFFDRARELRGRSWDRSWCSTGPDFAPNELPALATFLPALPRDMKVAIEFRQRGWIHDGVIALLAEHNVALALTDARWIPRKTMLSLAERPTADFTVHPVDGTGP